MLANIDFDKGQKGDVYFDHHPIGFLCSMAPVP